MADAAGLATLRGPSRRRWSGQGLRILVVDDNVDVTDTLATVLGGDLGHDISSLMTARRPLVSGKTSAWRPHLVILDIGLPGKDGYEVARRIRADPRLAGITLIAVTGWGQDEDRRQSKEAGMDDHLTKPVDPRAVQAFVAQI